MSKKRLDYLIAGPSAPYRGGIADTQNELGKYLAKAGKKTQLITFSKLYPNFLFPGKNQKRKEKLNTQVNTLEIIHSYNPFYWKKAIRYINKTNPKTIIFRYYTPFLAPLYGWIAKRTDDGIKKIALVDNWIPHERRFWDKIFNRFFGTQVQAFTTFSSEVASQIKDEFQKPIWEGFHPINTNLLPQISSALARKKLGWESEKYIVLFFGIIRKYKGLELLIQAFADKKFNSENIILKVVGECYEDKKKYTNLVTSLGLEKIVEFDFEFKTEQDIQLVFSGCDLVAQTYHTASQSGVTPIAYFYNKPLVVSDIEGLNTPIKEDNSGVCVKKNPCDIAKGIKYLLNDKVANNKIQNIKKALPRYSWKKWVKDWDEFIQNL